MAGLYKKVLKGVYTKIPNYYSESLSNIVKALIQVQATQRPDCS